VDQRREEIERKEEKDEGRIDEELSSPTSARAFSGP
jgi:hypothetical protein